MVMGLEGFEGYKVKGSWD